MIRKQRRKRPLDTQERKIERREKKRKRENYYTNWYRRIGIHELVYTNWYDANWYTRIIP